MSGQYLHHKERPPVNPHNCWKPGGVYGDLANYILNPLPPPSIGDVWRCDCGQCWLYAAPFLGTVAWDPISEKRALKILKKKARS